MFTGLWLRVLQVEHLAIVRFNHTYRLQSVQVVDANVPVAVTSSHVCAERIYLDAASAHFQTISGAGLVRAKIGYSRDGQIRDRIVVHIFGRRLR